MNDAQPCCLVCEDEAVIGIALEAYLEDEAFAVAGPFATGAEALSWTERTPDAAVLDFKLRGGLCTKIAEVLVSRGVPVVIYSGWPKGPDTPVALRQLIWLRKPADRPALLAALAGLAPSLAPRAVPDPSWGPSPLPC